MEENFKNGGQKESMLENEAEIVERAKKDDWAFEIIYNFYFPRIYGYIFKRVGSFDIAQDLVSSTFLKVFVNLDKYTSRGYAFGAWVYKIATNNLIDYYRKAGKKKEIGIDGAANLKDESQNTPEEAFARSEEKEYARRALKELPKKYQEVLNLKFFAEKSNKEMAEILKTNENNIRVLTYRALKYFRAAYKKYEK